MGRVVVVHPDLGIGGAERLIVDASKALRQCGHNVRVYTGYHNKDRCFEETIDGTFEVIQVGAWIPRSIFGKCHALMAYLKMIYIAIHLLIFSKHDVVLCDQVSACIPIFKLDFRNRPRIVFYCHFPDQLLTSRNSTLKRLYRMPLDCIEEQSTSAADVILVNSGFTESVVKQTFKSLRGRQLTTLYPCVSLDQFINFKPSLGECDEQVRRCWSISASNYVFLSLNRFERKKNLGLAIEALSECFRRYKLMNKGDQMMKAHLIVAGGYDDRLLDSVQYYEELKGLVEQLNLSSYITFVKSPSDIEKLHLLHLSHAILYTPDREHFGIVPLEAMAMSKPVVACASGGPLETIENEVNGLLCECDRSSFADAMLRLGCNRDLSSRMGAAGLERVRRQFSYETFRDILNEIVRVTD